MGCVLIFQAFPHVCYPPNAQEGRYYDYCLHSAIENTNPERSTHRLAEHRLELKSSDAQG